MFPVLIKTSFTMLDCTIEQPCASELHECTYYLDIAPSTAFYTLPMNGARWAFWDLKGDNKFYMLWAGIVSIVYIAIIPGIYFVLLRRARLSDDGFDSIERHRFGWFIMRYVRLIIIDHSITQPTLRAPSIRRSTLRGSRAL